MSVSSETNKVTYNCNGSTTGFAITFDYLTDSSGDAEQIQVVLTDETTGVDTVLTETTHYTISGGTVTTVATYSSDYKITLARDPDYTQTVDNVHGGAIDPDAIDRALDQLTMAVQKVAELTERSVKVSISDTSPSMTLPAADARAGTVLAFDENGDAYGATNLTGVTASTWAQTLLDDTTAAAARGTLELDTDDDVTFNSVTADLTGDVTGNVTGNVTGDVTGDVTGNVTGDVTGNADTATSAEGIETTGTGTPTLKCKVVEIGEWDMDSTANIAVATGIDLYTLRSATVLIREDDTSGDYVGSLFGVDPTTSIAGYYRVQPTNGDIRLYRIAGGPFDNENFDTTGGYNRGWITIWYEA